jgi:hypothetical protein
VRQQSRSVLKCPWESSETRETENLVKVPLSALSSTFETIQGFRDLVQGCHGKPVYAAELGLNGYPAP